MSLKGCVPAGCRRRASPARRRASPARRRASPARRRASPAKRRASPARTSSFSCQTPSFSWCISSSFSFKTSSLTKNVLHVKFVEIKKVNLLKCTEKSRMNGGGNCLHNCALYHQSTISEEYRKCIESC